MSRLTWWLHRCRGAMYKVFFEENWWGMRRCCRQENVIFSVASDVLRAENIAHLDSSLVLTSSVHPSLKLNWLLRSSAYTALYLNAMVRLVFNLTNQRGQHQDTPGRAIFLAQSAHWRTHISLLQCSHNESVDAVCMAHAKKSTRSGRLASKRCTKCVDSE